MGLFEYGDYRIYLREHIQSLPKKGRGELSKIAKYLGVNSTWVSQIMSGSQSFNVEQGYSLSQYFGHTELETEYFSLLIQVERAGTDAFKKHLQKKLAMVKKESLSLSRRVSSAQKLSDHESSVFYSSWVYSAVHIFTSLSGGGVTIDEIAGRFALEKPKAAQIVQFLVGAGIISEKSGRYHIGVRSTFLERGSPHLLKHHSSWRLKAIQRSENLDDEELMISGQYSLSRADFGRLRERIAELVKEVSQTVERTDPEDIVCLNLDWFWLRT